MITSNFANSSQYCHTKRLKEIKESDRSVKSRLSSGSSNRSGISLTGNRMMNYKKNHHNHVVFQTREHSNEINRRNERLFVRLQEIHSVSIEREKRLRFWSNVCLILSLQKKKTQLERSRTPVQFQGITSISSPMAKGTLNFPHKKREAARIDADNLKFAQRILN